MISCYYGLFAIRVEREPGPIGPKIEHAILVRLTPLFGVEN